MGSSKRHHEDADQMTDAPEPRTADLRRADAFFRLVINVGSAGRYLDRGIRND
jgi:hypothetical protein